MQSNLFATWAELAYLLKIYIFFSIVKSRGHEWPLRPISVGRSPSHVAHQLPGDAGGISSFETLCPRPERTSCTSAHSQWKIHTEVMEQIWKKFGRAQVDLFASRKTSQCPFWFSWTHPVPLGLDAMVQTWQRLRLYAFPPDCSA